MNDSLYRHLKAFGQEHVLQFADQLTPDGRERLEGQLRELDLQLINDLAKQGADAPDWSELARRATPPPAFRLDDRDGVAFMHQTLGKVVPHPSQTHNEDVGRFRRLVFSRYHRFTRCQMAAQSFRSFKWNMDSDGQLVKLLNAGIIVNISKMKKIFKQ